MVTPNITGRAAVLKTSTLAKAVFGESSTARAWSKDIDETGSDITTSVLWKMETLAGVWRVWFQLLSSRSHF